MAALSTESVDEVFAAIMQTWSSERMETPVTKAQLRALIVAVDTGLEAAETSIVSGLPGGAAKSWLIANQPVGRRVMEGVERKRRLTL